MAGTPETAAGSRAPHGSAVIEVERFRKIFEFSHDGIVVLDPQADTILDANPAICRLLGYDRDELLGTPPSAIHTRDTPLFQGFLRSVQETGAGWTNELTCTTKQRQQVPAEISASAVEVAGRPAVIAIVRDVTERVRLRGALAASEERFRRMVENAADAIFLLRADGRFVDVNHQASAQLGYSRDELLELTVFDISVGLKPEQFAASVAQLQRGATLTIEKVHRRKDASTYPVEVRSCALEMRAERLLLSAARDITERKRLEAAVHESRAQLARVVESAMDAILVFDDELRIRLLNPAAEAIFRCPVDAAVGQGVDRFLGAGFCRIVSRSRHEPGALAVEQPSLWIPEGLTAQRADGEEFPIEATISRSETADGPQYTVILRDTNERARAEEQIRRLELERSYLLEEIRSEQGFGEIVGTSAAMQKVFGAIEQVAETPASVLITGETGTGKELVARAIHQRSTRAERVLVKVNCAALPAGLIESELFGHEKGAFTGAVARKIGRFEMADGGTLFLDEIGDLPLELQAKLLRVLQDGEFERVGGTRPLHCDVRIIAATNRDLAAAVRDGRFRADLYYRLNVFPIHLPPLRERADDVALLARFFVSKHAPALGKRIRRIREPVIAALRRYSWPGNVRELENVIERGLITSTGPDLQLHPAQLAVEPAAEEATPTLDEVQRAHIVETLERTGWQVSGEKGAATLLGIKPSTLESRMKKLEIRRPKRS
jgi:formate hydrogenlyase transcriptional activator